MTDIETFLDTTVPDILKTVGFLFFVVSTRAVNVYLPVEVMLKGNEWDIVFVGSEDNMDKFTAKIGQKLIDKSFKIDIKFNKELSRDYIYNIYSSPFYSLTVNANDTAINFMNIYRIDEIVPGIGVFTENDGLLYSDLGFLVRELSREQENSTKRIDREIDPVKLDKELENVTKNLDEVAVKLEIGKHDITMELLNNIKYQLKTITISRELLFESLLSGHLNKIHTEKVLNVCRYLERYYNIYNGLKNQYNKLSN